MPVKPDPSVAARWLRLEPVKVGLLGLEVERSEREVHMAFDEAVERGVLDRRWELVLERERACRRARHRPASTRSRLADQGCLAVIGADYTDSALALVEHADACQVPLISMCGTDSFNGEYYFRLGNGDVGGARRSLPTG